jgi:multiple sugar transport system permease protein
MQMPNPMCLAALLPTPEGAWYHTPYPIWIADFLATVFVIVCLLRRVLLGIPRDLEDAARIDGCGFWRVCWNIVLPMLGPVLAFGGILIFLASWDDAMAPSLPDAPVGGGWGVGPGLNFGVIMAGGLLLMTPVIATFFLAQRYLRKGRLTGANG